MSLLNEAARCYLVSLDIMSPQLNRDGLTYSNDPNPIILGPNPIGKVLRTMGWVPMQDNFK